MTETDQKTTLELSLKKCLECGTLNMDSVLKIIMALKKKEKIRELHPYALTPPSKEGGRWQTSYRDVNGKRKNLRAKSEDELLDKLCKLYESSLHIEKLEFFTLYKDWLAYKKSVSNSPNTIKRHEQHYRKYLEISPLHKMAIEEIDEIFLEQECNRLVKEHNMTRKEWGNVKTILNGMFEYAVRKKYIKENILTKIRILVKYRQVVKKTGKTETFNTDECRKIMEYLDKMYQETNDVVFIAVLLNFFLGLRVGELVALKWEDLKEDKNLHVVREEVRNQEKNIYEVVEHTKTNNDRFVVLVPKAIQLLTRIEREGEYMFMHDGQRITARRASYVLEKYAERNGLATKSTHKIRKTFASRLNAKGVPLDCIRELLGHAELSTTLSYIYNPLTDEETYGLLEKALE